MPGDDGIGRNVASDHGTGSDHRALSDRDARQDGGIGPYGRAAADQRSGNGLLVLSAARERVVRESGVGAHEDILFQRDPIPKLHATLDGDSIADNHIVLDEGVIAYIAIGATRAPGRI